MNQERAVFQPQVVLYADGTVRVEWNYSFHAFFAGADSAADYDNDHGYSLTLDALLGYGTEAERLRRLADYIERHTCTGVVGADGRLTHDGDTCPIHEA